MAVVTSDFLAGVRTNFRALYEREFQAAQGLQGWQMLALPQSSDGELNTYNWFGTVPTMQDVTHGTVQLAGLLPDNFSLTNSEYQAAIEVERAAFERDKLGLIMPRIQQLGGEAARHPGQLIMQHVLNNNNAFDGSSFFSNSRTIGNSATIDNILTGTGTTIAQIQTDLASAKAQMRVFEDDQGRPMNLAGNTIMVPPELDDVMWRALNRSSGDGVNTPVMPVTPSGIWSASGYSVVVNPYLTDANDWYLFHVGQGVMKPFIYQTEKRPVLESATILDRTTILARTFVYSVYGRYATGMTDPRLGVQTTNT
jgi:phage major head subunit gpT-like protein